MKNIQFIIVLIFVIIIPGVGSSQNNFYNTPPNARAIGFGGSTVALQMDPAATYWNPATISFLTSDFILMNINSESQFNFSGFTKFYPPKFSAGFNVFRLAQGAESYDLASVALANRFNSVFSYGSNFNLGKFENGDFFSSFGFGFFIRSFPNFSSSENSSNRFWNWFRSTDMKNKLSLGIVLHNIPLVNLRNSQELRTGLALKPFQYGPLIHFAYHLNRKNDSFHLGGQINFINKVDLIAGFQDFDLNKSAVGLSAQIFDFIFDVSYRLQTEAVNISMQINFSEPKKDMAQKYRGSGAKKVKNNDYFGGLKEYYKALAYDPEDENINLIVSALREKVDNRRMKIDSLFTLGQSFEEKGWYVNAFNTYRGILNVDPANRKTRKQMKSINSKVNKHIGELYVQGADYYKRNEMSQAEIVFRKILSVNKSHEGANFYIEKIDSIKSFTFSEYYFRGIGYFKQKKLSRALQELNKAIALNPNDKNALDYRNQVEREIKENKAKIASLKRQAENYERRSLFVKANSCYRQILDLDSENQNAKDKLVYLRNYISKVVRSKYYAAKKLYDRKNFQEAIRAFNEILSIDPNHRSSRNYLNKSRRGLDDLLSQKYGQALEQYNKKQYEGSLENINFILDLDPNYDLALSLQAKIFSNINLENLRKKGIQYFQNQDYVNAKKTFNQILEQAPENGEAKQYRDLCETKLSERIEQLFNDGMVSYSEGDYNTAIQVWSRVLNIDPKHSSTLEYIQKATQRLRAIDNIKEK
ncbi:hypothetical protein B6I21_02855 [candidate division KSB1 bacterium 4572_119]|nr:MAG: hypothetical protein B6I21_02855 [candidate division KSB1 bacterium 4572_119]